ncbi:hypothetical protein U9M48_026865 [Paspalum notatum var. saurae]|uniref:Uncharacterized protein n=1 Tax=Paspalum notatum var. saurae TaxID=547442 RepID=A0AAQ3TTL2_PASNO
MSLGSSSSSHHRAAQGAVTGLTAGCKVGMRTGLPLVPCPKCGDEVMELRASDLSKILGQIFFKCRLHEKDVPGTCPFYLLAEKYEKFLQNYGVLGHNEVEVGRKFGLKMEHTAPTLVEQVGRLQTELDRFGREMFKVD